MSYFHVSSFDVQVLIIDLFISILLLFLLRFILAKTMKLNSVYELSVSDNPSFGILFASLVMGYVFMILGLMSGEALDTPLEEFIYVSIFGLVAMAFMVASRYIFNKVSFKKIDIDEQIKNKNIAAAILDGGNILATSIIIGSALTVTNDDFYGIFILLVIYILSQMLFSIISYIRIKFTSNLPDLISSNNIASALRFSGFQIAMGVALKTANVALDGSIGNFFSFVINWLAVSIVLILAIVIVTFIAKRIVLFKIDYRDEVETQANSAIGILQASIYIAVALIVSKIFII